MATTTDGLSTPDIDGIREALTAGRKPKVMFTEAAGQIAGEIGQVVRLTDPDGSDEWVVVQFGRDELPFSPSDLTLPPKGRTAKKATAKSTTKNPPKEEPMNEPASAAVPTPRAESNATSKPPADAEGSGEPAKAARPTKRTARSAKSKTPAGLTVTLAYESGEWTVAAHQGSKTIAKPYVVRSSEALKMVSMLDVPGVHDAVEAIVAAERAEAAQRAEALRSELAEVEARLADLKEVG